ncbi:MAG: FAD-binding oxidoreductase [Pseudomonadota bacterium]
MRRAVTKRPFDPGPAAWNEILGARQANPPLTEKKTADFCVIGAGFAGLSAARRLRQIHPSASIVVLEARQIAEGPAGRNSGFMIDLPHHLASKDYAGAVERDIKATTMNREAIAFAKDAMADYDMPSDALREDGKINAAASDKGHHHNLDYARHLGRMSEIHEVLDAKQMSEISGSTYYKSGLFTPGTVMLQPALYMRSLAGGLKRDGVEIYEKSPVTALTRNGLIWSVETPDGTVEADKVILSVNGHAESFGYFERRLMHIYLYASMTRPLTDEEKVKLGGRARWGFTPADPLGTTVRKIVSPQGTRIVVRNRFTWAPGRTVSESKLVAMARVHDRSFRKRFPQLKNVAMEYRWGGLLCLSRNGSNAFGEVDENLFSACCQNGLGTAMGTLSGKLAADLACGSFSPSLQSMLHQPDPQMLPPEPFASIGANAFMRWGEIKAGAEL